MLAFLSVCLIPSTHPIAADEFPMITTFTLQLPLFKHNRRIRAVLYACRAVLPIACAKLTFLYHFAFGWQYGSVRANKYAGITAHAFVAVGHNHAILNGKSARDAGFYTDRVYAMPARNRKTDLVLLFYINVGANLCIF